MKPEYTPTLRKKQRALPLQTPERVPSGRDSPIPWAPSAALQYISQAALKQGVHIMGGPGSGKSRLLGRVFGFSALVRQHPLVVIDPTGAVVDNIADKLIRLPVALQEQCWSRIVYVDVGSSDYVIPTPLYYSQSPAETLFEIANRLPSVFERQDPALADAPILGLNALKECAIYMGQIAAAFGRQLDFVVDLIDHPGTYKGQLREVLSTHPELQPAVQYVRELMDPTSGKLREKRTGSFKTKLLPFLADPTMLATFAGTRRQLNWAKVISERKVVLLDLRHERDPDRRQFKMIWYLKTFTDYIKYRGMAGRGQEVMLIIDEITDMLGQQTKAGQSILVEDLEELITRLARNCGVNVIVAHQNLSQLEERMQNVLMQMGTQLIGVLPNPDDALRVARQFLRYDPYLLKKTERVWMKIDPIPILTYFGEPEFSTPRVIDEHTIEFTSEEQLLLLANKLQSLGRFRFLAQIAAGEGDLRHAVKRLSIQRLDETQYPNEQMLAPLRRQLAQRDGVLVATLLADIRARHAGEMQQKPQKPSKRSATMESLPVPQRPDTHVPADHLSNTSEPATPPVPPAYEVQEKLKDDPVFQ